MGGKQPEQRWYVACLETNEGTSLIPGAWCREGRQILQEEGDGCQALGPQLAGYWN